MKTSLGMVFIICMLFCCRTDLPSKDSPEAPSSKKEIASQDKIRDFKDTTIYTLNDSVSVIYELLRQSDVLDGHYPKSGIISFRKILLTNHQLLIVQLEISDSSSVFNSDPIYNVFATLRDSIVVCHFVMPSNNYDDLKILTVEKDFIAVKIYESSIGYSEILLFSGLENAFFKSEKISENETVLKNKFDLHSLTMETIDMQKEVKKRRLIKDVWSSCRAR